MIPVVCTCKLCDICCQNEALPGQVHTLQDAPLRQDTLFASTSAPLDPFLDPCAHSTGQIFVRISRNVPFVNIFKFSSLTFLTKIGLYAIKTVWSNFD